MTTPGKYRHLSRCANPLGHFVVLAIDHRANLLRALNQYASAPLSDEQFTAFKLAVIGALPADDPSVSAVLTDPAYGIGGGIAGRLLHGRLGLLAPVEVTNYDLSPDQRAVEFIPGWSVKKIKRVGGDGVKLLLSYHPEAPDAQQKQSIVRRIVDECGEYDIPFFLEPITYSPDPSTDLTDAELRQITVEMAQLFSAMGVDVLKLHFPVLTDDENIWRIACEDVDAVCTVPWTLLSAGVPYAKFVRQARVACAAGASGVIVGRAVWNEAISLPDEARTAFLETTLPARMAELAEECARHAAPWYDRVSAPDMALNWYEDYGTL